MKFTKYKRTQVAELAPWDETVDMSDVSIASVDRANGSPKLGDMIARNPANHEDKWLIASDYFRANFEPAD